MIISSRAKVTGGAVALLAVCGVMSDWVPPHNRSTKEPTERELKPDLEPDIPAPEPFIIKPLSPEEAVLANASMPISGDPLEPAPPFDGDAVLADKLLHQAAADCLAAAIYYEAANESELGQRAVAQVVLNRVRHPAYPSSVCGVVYQGSTRSTGCQFTFTCDGSLRRQPSESGWIRARKFALEALQGKVVATVGMATHYHANYVVPYWAASLSKIGAIGTHVFYRWKGFWGERRAFTQLYSEEPGSWLARGVPLLARPETAVSPIDSSTPLSSGQPLADQSSTPLRQQPSSMAAMPELPLKADELIRPLLVDEKEASLKADVEREKLPFGT